MPNDVIVELEDLLEEERKRLLDGELQALEDLYQRKEKLLQALDESDSRDSQKLRELQTSAQRNHALLEAAGKGLMQARDRVQEISKAVRKLETYSAQGGVQDVLVPAPTLSLRA